MTLERTPQQQPPGGEPSQVFRGLAALPASAAQTLLGLQLLAPAQQTIPLDPEWIATQLFPNQPTDQAAERIVVDVLELEDAGYVHTWAQNGREWLALTFQLGSTPNAASTHPAPPAAWAEPVPMPAFSSPREPLPTPPFSSAWEREKEREKERGREWAQTRARDRLQQEDLEQAAHWSREYATEKPPARPKRPARLQAPPLGCADHPHGTLEACGPCGTAAERRRTFLDRHRYEQELTLFEESQWEDLADETF